MVKNFEYMKLLRLKFLDGLAPKRELEILFRLLLKVAVVILD